MTRVLAVLLPLLLIATACGSPPAAPAFVDYRNERFGFAIRVPEGWRRVAGTPGTEVRIVPADSPDAGAEFISVFTVESPNGATEIEVRRHVFALLPIHGVSGFQQDARTTADILWYKFEVTGSIAGTEWASVGAAAAGTARLQVAACAKPLPRWRAGQKQCDEVIRSFRPGDLKNE